MPDHLPTSSKNPDTIPAILDIDGPRQALSAIQSWNHRPGKIDPVRQVMRVERNA
jgi:hypothetical protein